MQQYTEEQAMVILTQRIDRDFNKYKLRQSVHESTDWTPTVLSYLTQTYTEKGYTIQAAKDPQPMQNNSINTIRPFDNMEWVPTKSGKDRFFFVVKKPKTDAI